VYQNKKGLKIFKISKTLYKVVSFEFRFLPIFKKLVYYAHATCMRV